MRSQPIITPPTDYATRKCCTNKTMDFTPKASDPSHQRKLMQREPAKLDTAHQAQLTELFQHSQVLETMHQMRVELGAIWGRSHFTRDQLLHQLQDWCARAEASGIKALEDFSLRLRSYA